MHRLQLVSRRLLTAVVVLGLVAAPATPAVAVPDAAEGGELSIELLAKAVADECFAGVGVPYPPGPPCAQGQPKVNDAYVWGLAKAGHRLWFGTGANVLCLKPENYTVREPVLNDDYTCEYGQSQPAQQNPALPDPLGDHRPPEIYVYDLAARRLTDRTADLTGADAALLRDTAGLRAGTAHRGVVLLAGPSLTAGVNVFAFDAITGAFLGSTKLTAYENIRHFAVAAGVLYAGVGIGVNGGEGGRVLRWTGDRTDPFGFVEVGVLPTQAADMASHNGRLYVTTWPEAVVEETLTAAPGTVAAATAAATGAVVAPAAPGDTDGLAAVWMSPLLLDGEPGLNPEDAGAWRQVWHTGMYEPDPVIASSYALGGLESYRGQLYWGTMHVPLQATALHTAVYRPRTPEAVRATLLNTQRASALFRGRFLGTDHQRIELLYGAAELPAYDPTAGGAGAWGAEPTGSTPLFGASGFGNPFNAYIWKMAVAGDRLYVGTMDWTYLAGANLNPDPAEFGGDLWVFDSAQEPATAIDTRGVGNYLNQGVRNMVADGDVLYLGIANPFNLRTDPTDDIPEGGWELIRVAPAE